MAQRNNEKRNQILSVAYEYFSRMPYAQVSLANIAEGAEINKSLLQHYYARKNDIIKALLDELLAFSSAFMNELPYDYSDMFLKISDFNMLFFKAAAKSQKLDQFITASVSQPELLALWDDSICGWLRGLCGEDTFTYLQLRTAISFSMAGSMHLYQHRDELGIDYRFICRNHIHSIMSLLQFEHADIAAICDQTDARLPDLPVDSYLKYCEDHISWFTR